MIQYQPWALLVGRILLAYMFIVSGWGKITGFVAIATVIFHDFWNVPAEQVRLQTIMFNKNLAIMGGMLYVAFMGPGRLSLDKA
jgi:uncharacterized membrane protein YphA (DoxX/SURF4 family)